MSWPQPRAEAARLEALRAYRVLDTPPEQDYDDFTLLASAICEAPIALVSLVDADRQWLKAKVGIDVDETPRDVAFCAHAILDTVLMEVPDATADDRFASNPLVTSDPKIRFYAGAPLVTPAGHSIGTLCVIDRQPRTLTAAQRVALEALARRVVVQLELRRTAAELASALETIKTIEGLVPICAWCKRVRDDDDYWATVEQFIEEHTEASFTHGICPDCYAKVQEDVQQISRKSDEK